MNKLAVLLLFVGVFEIAAQKTVEKLSYHNIKTDKEGKILPWYSDDLGQAYDYVINLTWKFWDSMRIDSNGLPYYMNHQVWKRDKNDPRGIGGDQISMALSSWRLLYAYNGNPKILENMKFMADYYLSHSLSSKECVWPNIPYPYNTSVLSGVYDGDMILGKGYTQPDKAGSFGYELLNLYKITEDTKYLEAATDIANTLSKHVVAGHQYQSPLPYRVDALTGEVGVLKDGEIEKIKYAYTTNWTSTMYLFRDLSAIKNGKVEQFKNSYNTIINWMKTYPMKTNKWGPFFEDVGLWSDTQINAVTFAEFVLMNPNEFSDWKKESFQIIDWVYEELINEKWESYGVAVVNEQTHYRVPGNSHTARQGSVELLYASKTGDEFRKGVGLRQLNWATYMVNTDGENTYPNNETWLTDGYGDYVRHYLKAMSIFPELAPANQNHLIKTSSIVKFIRYSANKIEYEVFDKTSSEVLRLKSKPKKVSINDKPLNESGKLDKKNYWSWVPLNKGGVMNLVHKSGTKIKIEF
ncbi:MAG: hypothetical protein WCZ90_13905 [Melioribacteraceae bacterium]